LTVLSLVSVWVECFVDVVATLFVVFVLVDIRTLVTVVVLRLLAVTVACTSVT
jgi:hypothetical protein